jgi:serine/threonine-protein kinase
MGSVYEVVHLETKRRRVLKTMLPNLLTDSDMRDRFKLEATVTARIESEHIVEVFDAGFDIATGLPYLVMEYLRGESLAAVLGRGPVSPEDCIAILYQASLALDRTHAAGIVHRDLKPENLFLTKRDDGTLRLKLLDFGIAKVISLSTDVNTTRSFGTPLYMSPEQFRGDGDVDGRADVYALGQIGFTLLVGKPYWQPEAVQAGGVYPLLLKLMKGMPETASVRAARQGARLPPEFDDWFSQATHPEASHRYDSASELVERLAAALKLPLPKPLRTSALIDGVHAMSAGPGPAIAERPMRSPATLAGVAHTSKEVKPSHPRPLLAAKPGRSAITILVLGLSGALLVMTMAYLRATRRGTGITATASAGLSASIDSTRSQVAASMMPVGVPVETATPSIFNPDAGVHTPPAVVATEINAMGAPAPAPNASARESVRSAKPRARPSATDAYDPSDVR